METTSLFGGAEWGTGGDGGGLVHFMISRGFDNQPDGVQPFP